MKALLGQLDRRLDQFRPRQAAVRAVCLLQHAHRARHADRAATDHAVVEGHGQGAGEVALLPVGGGAGVEQDEARLATHRGVDVIDGDEAAVSGGEGGGGRGGVLHRGGELGRAQDDGRRSAPARGAAAQEGRHVVDGLGGERLGVGQHRRPGATPQAWA